MASILDLLNTTVGEEFISRASEYTSENPNNVSGVLGLALPLLLGGLKKNVSREEGAKNLDTALASGKHGQQRITDFGKLHSSEITEEGDKILNHIFSGDLDNIFQTISTTLEIEKSSVSKIVKMAAPLLMTILASQKEKENLESTDLESLISSVMGSSSKFDSSLIETLLSKDHNSNVINDVKGMILGGGTKGKKDGGIMGGMLGSK